MRAFVCVIQGFLLPLLAGCNSATTTPGNNPNTQSYQAQGVIEQVAPDHRQLTIHNQAIPGYMMEMTMDFAVRNASEVQGLSAGDQVTFTLIVNKDDSYIEHIARVGHTDAPATQATTTTDAPPKLKVGDKLPDSELLAENGQTIHLSDFHGKAVAFTFFFIRCPLPNYCPLMNRNFAETRKLLLSTPNAPANWELLSISFDADYDRPDALTSFAAAYRDDNADRWLFASASPATLAQLASPLGLLVMGQGLGISHNLRTVVVDPEGRLFRQFNDNLWTPRQLADAILAAARQP
jgi:protein SCO1/2